MIADGEPVLVYSIDHWMLDGQVYYKSKADGFQSAEYDVTSGLLWLVRGWRPRGHADSSLDDIWIP